MVASLLIPIYAWSRRGSHLPVAVLAGLLLVGIWTWPLAWRGGVATVAPFLWLLISATTAAIVRVDATGTTMVTIDHDGAVSLS